VGLIGALYSMFWISSLRASIFSGMFGSLSSSSKSAKSFSPVTVSSSAILLIGFSGYKISLLLKSF